MKCEQCGTEHRYVGVMYPARALCNCEDGACSECEAPAVIVEFQRPVAKKGEPPLGGRLAKLFCIEHRPEGFPTDALVGDTPTTKAGRLPHIDPVWERATSKLPEGAESKLKVKCIECGHEHLCCERVMFNGTYSFCPQCNQNMYVPSGDEEMIDVASAEDSRPSQGPIQGPRGKTRKARGSDEEESGTVGEGDAD